MNRMTRSKSNVFASRPDATFITCCMLLLRGGYTRFYGERDTRKKTEQSFLKLKPLGRYTIYLLASMPSRIVINDFVLIA